ncbi:hypothetical protein [Fredinandcohnia onubensis]|nr:hypothetical protein [Fredinandcohnia onubensis]
MQHWLTPEEVERRKNRNKIILYCTLPIVVIAVSALITIATNQL